MSRRAVLTFRYPKKAEPYADAMRQAGIEPVPGPLDNAQGLVLSGGTDLNPALYGEAPHPEGEEPDDELDAEEARLLRQALARDLPVLAICRGLQLFNVVHGGSLIQHLDTAPVHVRRDVDPALAVHPILVEPGSRLAGILGAGEHQVNSRHHQAVHRIGEGLRVTARSMGDGVIEALERDDCRFALAVQWHPEDQIRKDATQLKLFEAFGAALE